MKHAVIFALTIIASAYAQEHKHTMQGMYGPYAMTREASGTSWQPESTPMIGPHWMGPDWGMMVSGFINGIYDRQGGPRGDEKVFSKSMLMLMSHKQTAAGTFGFRSMVSFDPLMGKKGYPLLLQTGETADGKTHLIDRQHPHDCFMELAGTYHLPITNQSSIFAYVGLPGEPALGPPTFMQRWSGIEIPEAPLTHHWLDSTHITFGVVTLGYIWHSIKLEGSAFRGREPDQNRWNIESPKLDSYAARISYNPTDHWAFQISYGNLKSPEQLEPQTNKRRTTASIIYNRPFQRANNWQTTLAWGQNASTPGHTLNGYLLESTVNFRQKHTFFGRLERVDEDELREDHHVLTVNKFSFGYIYDFPPWRHLHFGIGGLASTYILPASLRTLYGKPVSYFLFVRLKYS